MARTLGPGPSRRAFLLGTGAATLTLAGCSIGTEQVFSGGTSGNTITVAIVSNSQMQDAISLSDLFTSEHPDISLKFVSLPENEARAKITADVSTQGGEFDVVMISNYETPMWSANGWLANLQPYINATPGYDANDFLPQLRATLSHKGDLYSVPFYGESSFLMYRKDLMASAGIKMPLHPTWDQVAQIAERMHNPAKGRAGICLRGDPGWGENLAPLDTVINSFGGRWFTPQWEAQLTSPEVTRAATLYVSLLQKYGEPGAPEAGFSECATLYGQGDAAMWYDATSAVGSIEDPQNSHVVGKNGYVWAPTQDGRPSGWLYTWSLAIPETSSNKQSAWDFISWMTSKSYIKTVGQKLGWSHVPPGSRFSSYQIPQYRKLSSVYGPLTLQSINATNSAHPCTQPVPYTGVQFLDIPEFQDLGTNVSEQFSACIAGQQSVATTLAQAQQYAQAVGDTYK
ncbi:MAG TPA: sugar ABC transporter substrate-binding protein [Streptosporangiaceae bacterium]|jgi:sorbitol/mannitol transport system substrate-binding protein|nr:sugar ABC transporter substrate-binding protein [Streptosporangiaceae bacterium]